MTEETMKTRSPSGFQGPEIALFTELDWRPQVLARTLVQRARLVEKYDQLSRKRHYSRWYRLRRKFSPTVEMTMDWMQQQIKDEIDALDASATKDLAYYIALWLEKNYDVS